MVAIDMAKVGTIINGMHIAFGFALLVATGYVSKKSLIEPEYQGDLKIFFEVGYGYGFLGVTTSLLTMMYGAYYIYYFTLSKATQPQRLLQRYHGWGGALWLMLLQLSFLFGALLWIQETIDNDPTQAVLESCGNNVHSCDIILDDDSVPSSAYYPSGTLKPVCGQTSSGHTYDSSCFLACKFGTSTQEVYFPSYHDGPTLKPCKGRYIGKDSTTPIPTLGEAQDLPSVRVLAGGGDKNNVSGKNDNLAKAFSAIVAFGVLCFLGQCVLLSLISRYPEQFGGDGEISGGDSSTSINISLASLILMGLELAFGFALFVVACYLAEKSLTEPEYEGALTELFRVNYGVGFVGITCAFNVLAYGLTHLWFFKMGKTNNAQRIVNRMQGWGGATILMCLQVAILYGYIVYQVHTIDNLGKEGSSQQLVENCGTKIACKYLAAGDSSECDKDCAKLCNKGNDSPSGGGLSPCNSPDDLARGFYPNFRTFSGLTDANENKDKDHLNSGLNAAIAFSVLLLLNHIPWEFFLSKYPGQFGSSGKYAPQENTYDDAGQAQSSSDANYGGTADGGGYQSL